MTELTKRKISYALRGHRKSATTRLLIANSLKGQKKTDEHKAAISAAMKRVWISRNKQQV